MTSAAPPQTDPRIPSEGTVLPIVARPRAGTPVWVVVLAAVALGVILFVVLETRRRNATAPAVRPATAEALPAMTPPPLYVPPVPPPATLVTIPAAPPPAAPAPAPFRQAPQPPAVVVVQQPQPNPAPQQMPALPTRVTADPSLVIDTTAPRASADQPTGAAGEPGQGSRPTTQTSTVAGGRASAGVLANRGTTVPQGTLVPAVLETALDSNRPGLARAIVSRDVRGFDGNRVLIPRGSRLIGEYGAQVEGGQNRLLVNWIRLIRPDGATVAIGSPAADTMGRTGIRASVNSHFFERFAGAILQSALDVGVNLASRSIDSPVYVLPGAQSFRPMPNQIRPTLKVKAATSISIFVARDLDFTSVEAR